MLSDAIQHGRSEDQKARAGHSEAFSRAVSAEVVGAVVARLLQRLSAATGQPMPAILAEVDPGIRSTAFGGPWNAGDLDTSGDTTSAEPVAEAR